MSTVSLLFLNTKFSFKKNEEKNSYLKSEQIIEKHKQP